MAGRLKQPSVEMLNSWSDVLEIAKGDFFQIQETKWKIVKFSKFFNILNFILVVKFLLFKKIQATQKKFCLLISPRVIKFCEKHDVEYCLKRNKKTR